MNIRQLLIEKYDYPEKGAEFMAKKLEALTGAFAQALEKWAATGEPASPGEYWGYTIDGLMKEYGMNYPAALTTLEWLDRDGEAAVQMLKKGVK